ncbi:hypothetical protein SS1G_08928 [Sclerotinia sclerotiorum 1980 UF-70]|uniref:Uncharacterized protein n=1 Tax=Sclerotinia sclerotiorum (strain ATCC 18683 / 1980 / Ss-1) TaxID=665079 RepID=A7EUC1_SCLS1|nr:hypothetical protein SS1G_08928 [Sclerotinia sclerotiorum 1980 UF-70]EDN93063.1 hypothetical protein SS1G_08928 [Sclerotinia sclerotiorum 1980 UF-70]
MGNGAIVPDPANDWKSPGEGRRVICSLALPCGRLESRIGFRVLESVG